MKFLLIQRIWIISSGYSRWRESFLRCFEKVGTAHFLSRSLQAVFDPRGGYFKPGTGDFVPSLVAEIGSVIEEHMKYIGMIRNEPRPAYVQQILDEKRAEYERRTTLKNGSAEDSFPPGAQLCKVCHVSAVIVLDGCLTCLNCGDSKCSWCCRARNSSLLQALR